MEEIKEKKLNRVVKTFNKIADRYIIANHLLSFGQDVCWRKTMCEMVCPMVENKDVVLDIASGTGENFKYCLNSFRKKFALDPAFNMLKVGKSRLSDINFVKGIAEELPFKDETVDLITSSFGVRNFADRKRSFGEFSRVLKKNGVFAVLEFFPMENGSFINKTASFYIYNILPYLGGVITGDLKAYRYLARSIKNFISPYIMKIELENTGLKVEKIHRMFPNVYVIIGRKI
ncbi:ubiquinone/menaquinone biosynthesis methyltransferase [Persephonella sp.]